MKGFRSGLLSVLLAVGVASAARAADPVDWPATELSQHAQAWFAMLAADDATARGFFGEHMAPSAMAEAGLEERMARRKMVQTRSGGLTPRAIVSSAPALLEVRCDAGNGDVVVAIFEGEPESPNRIVGVRLEAGPPGSDGPGREPPSGPPLPDAEAAQAIRDTLAARSARGDWSGSVLLARGEGTLLDVAYGLADRKAKRANTTATRFNVGSIGKLFTRTAIAQLAQQGKLSLDDKLSRYLPDFPHADAITIEQLCEHRSGVGDFFNDRYQSMDRSKLRHNRDYLELIRDQPLWFAPGTSERYSNGGYALLGEVIAKASGEDYYHYLVRHVFSPAGMNDTGAPLEGDGTKGLARGYTRTSGAGTPAPAGRGEEGEYDNVATRPARGSAAGGSYSTTHDLLAFDHALLSGKMCSLPWADWVCGGPRPDRGGAGPPSSPRFGFAGGAPGLNAEWLHQGDVVLIVLTNRDPETARGTVQALRDIVRRMSTGKTKPS